MRTTVPTGRFRTALVLAALVLAGAGCACFRKPSPAVPPPETPVGETAVPRTPAGTEAVPVADPAKQNGRTNGNGRLVPDPEKIHALQTRVIEEQRAGADDCLFRKKCGFACWLDRVHDTWYRRMDNAVRTVDTRWLSESVRYDPELSTFRLRTLFRAGGRSSEEDYEFKV